MAGHWSFFLAFSPPIRNTLSAIQTAPFYATKSGKSPRGKIDFFPSLAKMAAGHEETSKTYHQQIAYKTTTSKLEETTSKLEQKREVRGRPVRHHI